ncbi:MAG: ORF6N domain-containing protein, partial [Muribaculaceae bacterium]|nr:ORF6N domain-containing protein [Muribaculaceae bacterium]
GKIYEIRGQRIILDFDLAAMYGVETRVLNQAVKRNLSRFPQDFMFQLSKEEWEMMSSQIVMTLPTKRPKSALPFAFTEHGVVMLSSVLRSDTAIQINIAVTRAFVAMRKMVTANPIALRLSNLEKSFEELKQDLEEIFSDYNDINEDTRMQLDAINTALADLQSSDSHRKPRPKIGFKTDET